MKKVLRRIFVADGEQEDETELWMLPYSTLMLTLVILFIAFYAVSEMQSKRSVEYEAALATLSGTGKANPRAEAVRREVAMARNLQETVRTNRLADKIQVEISARFIKMNLQAPSFFDSGRAELKADALSILRELLQYQKTMNNTIIVEGHTDNVPIHSAQFSSNWELSAARAFSVIRYFIDNGIDPKRLVAHGYGEFRPVVSNETDEGRGRNRRIEITIVRGEAKL